MAHDRASQGEALALAAGQAPHSRVRDITEAEAGEQRLRVTRPGVQSRDVTNDSRGRGRLGKSAFLQHDPHAFAQALGVTRIAAVETEHRNVSPVRPPQALAAFDRSGLSRAVGPK